MIDFGKVREMSKQDTLNNLGEIVKSIRDVIDYDNIMSEPQKRFLKNAIVEIQKAVYVVRISKN
jgi:hypothetical protein